jgi:c-di-GMP-binding flagellar brake protein YcgR
MEIAARRRHQRIPVPEELEIRVAGDGGGLLVEGTATVIGLGGMFVRSNAIAPPGTGLSLAATCPFLTIESRCTVRHVMEDGMGIEFTGLSRANEQKLKWLLFQLRAQWPRAW